MQPITDEYMKEMLQKSKPYTIVILHKTGKFGQPGTDKTVWEHGRRNFQLRQDGRLRIVCAIRDSTDTSGVGVYSTNENDTRKIMDGDPGVMAGIFSYEMHPTRSFPGDSLSN